MALARWFLVAFILLLALVLVQTSRSSGRDLQAHLSRVKHADDVARFFRNHPRLASTRAGRNALWQQKRARAVSLRSIRLLRRQMWLKLPYTNDWVTATKIVQRPFPGTQGFLLRTSDREGGRGGCVIYGGSPCYIGYHGGVAGNLQYMRGTFTGHYRRALESLRARGFVLPVELTLDPVTYGAWFSPMSQALAGAWACWAHETRSHWSASGNYC